MFRCPIGKGCYKRTGLQNSASHQRIPIGDGRVFYQLVKIGSGHGFVFVPLHQLRCQRFLGQLWLGAIRQNFQKRKAKILLIPGETVDHIIRRIVGILLIVRRVNLQKAQAFHDLGAFQFAVEGGDPLYNPHLQVLFQLLGKRTDKAIGPFYQGSSAQHAGILHIFFCGNGVHQLIYIANTWRIHKQALRSNIIVQRCQQLHFRLGQLVAILLLLQQPQLLQYHRAGPFRCSHKHF